MNKDDAIKALRDALSNLEKEFVRVFPIYYYSEPWAHDKNIQLANARAALAATAEVEDGWVLVPIEPTQDMIIAGFESVPDRVFDGENYPEEYDSMSGCQKAAFRAKRCWAAMLAAVPSAQVAAQGKESETWA